MIGKLAVILVAVTVLCHINGGAAVTKCYQCESNKEENCINKLSAIEPKQCDAEKQKYCVTAVDTKGIVSRSCSNEPCNDNLPNCKSSDQDNGNDHNICQSCSSSKDPKCAQSENSVITFNKVCEKADTKCLINIKDKNTERDCASADDEKNCVDKDTCKTCTGGNCNSGIFPTNRLSCYQCNSSACKDVSANSDSVKSLPCVSYDSNDKCYTFGTSSTADMKRGCVSDTDKDNSCSSPGSNVLCATCDKANCNNQNYMRDQSLKCIQCTSSATDTKCKWGMDSSEAKNCINKIEYYKKEMCFTQSKDGTVYRGCYYDREDSLGKCEDGTCKTCSNPDGCNNKDEGAFTCIRCRSDIDKKCYDEADKIQGTECRNSVTPSDIGCFHGKWNGIVIRGCLVDATERVEATCKDAKNTQCNYCKEANCNNKKTSSATRILSQFGAIFLIGVVFVMQKF